MKKMKIVLSVLVIVLTLGISSCSSVHDTKRADLDDAKYQPMRDRNQDETSNTAGHQNDQIRKEHR